MLSPAKTVSLGWSFFKQAYVGFPKEAWILAGSVLLNRLGTMVLPFLALYLTQQRGFSPTVVGNVLMLWGAGGIAGTLTGGWLADKAGALRVQIVSLWGSAACLWGLYEASSVGVLYAMAFVSTWVIDVFRPANVTCMMAVCDAPMRPRALTLVRLAVNMGMSVGPALGGVLAGYGYHWVFGVDAATSFAAGVLLFVLLGRHPSPAFQQTVVSSSGPVSSQTLSPWKDTLFRSYFLLNMLLLTVYFQLLGVWSVYLKTYYHLGESTLGVLWGLSCFLAALCEMPYMRLFKPSTALYSVAVGALALALGCVCLPLGTHPSLAWISVAFFALAEVLWMPMLGSMATTHPPAHARGRYIGMYSSSAAWALLVAPWLGTRLYAHVSPHAVWWCVACLAVLGAVWAYVMQQQKNKRNTGVWV
jgi:predicted MFS family arabinose efflux permease